MMLPITTSLADSTRVLLCGMGGGFDVYGAIPLALKLNRLGYEVILSSLNTSGCSEFGLVKKDSEVYPENELAKRFSQLYVLPRTGVKSMVSMYKEIDRKHKIESVIMVDGGVDSLMHGDEEGSGTLLEDSMSLAAIGEAFPNVNKYLACVGFGTETEEGVDHYRVLENIAELAKERAFLGVSSLTADDEDFRQYAAICNEAWANGRKSHVHPRIIASVMGCFGSSNEQGIDARVAGPHQDPEFVTPLMSIYWFFKYDAVAAKNLLLPHLKNTGTSVDALMMFRQILPQLLKNRRERKKFPY